MKRPDKAPLRSSTSSSSGNKKQENDTVMTESNSNDNGNKNNNNNNNNNNIKNESGQDSNENNDQTPAKFSHPLEAKMMGMEPWNCARCTWENQGGTTECEVCGEAKP